MRSIVLVTQLSSSTLSFAPIICRSFMNSLFSSSILIEARDTLRSGLIILSKPKSDCEEVNPGRFLLSIEETGIARKTGISSMILCCFSGERLVIGFGG